MWHFTDKGKLSADLRARTLPALLIIFIRLWLQYSTFCFSVKYIFRSIFLKPLIRTDKYQKQRRHEEKCQE